MEKNQIIYGLRPIMEAIKAGKTIDKVYFQSNLQGKLFSELKALIKQSGKQIQQQYVPLEKLDYLSRKQNHQGVVAQLSQIEYWELDDLLVYVEGKETKPFLVYLDNVTDVRNLGAIARSAECAGADALILPQQGSAPINQDAIKTSAGALLRLPVCKVNNPKTFINTIKAHDIKIYSASEKASTLYTQINADEALMLVMGNEEHGVSSTMLKMSDELIKIPMKGDIESLNVSAAASVLLFEVVRQRLKI
ncbi:MAG: 23S rRNA (guanosine(2251)-2'-O)-methyltransferase RlmB [Bacteroidales bacterium]|jgi:23S rRNA (guanosine2251-2'-O)-methyltransferase|nr:23S rRNA (guanosine(2251)-2'-O)-methyltransferase RlmB [Bacteroidales bacterium]